MHVINGDINVVLPMGMVLIGFLEIASIEVTRGEAATTSVEGILMLPLIGHVMLTLHGLKGVARAEEALYLRVVVVVVRRLDLLWVLSLELNVMELVREASMGTV